MAGNTVEDWLYNEDLDVHIGAERDRLSSTDSRVLEGDDLLDDVLTAPSATPPRARRPASTTEDELLSVQEEEQAGMEDSGSARFNAEQMARMVQARIEANRTSQGAMDRNGTTIYSREPNRKNSVFIGNLTWWTTDQDLIHAVREAGLKDVINIKFFENRANGQSKGHALVELGNETLAANAAEKLQEFTIHNQKPIVMHALKISPHQFEVKCNSAKSGIEIPQPPKQQPTQQAQPQQLKFTTTTSTPPIAPPIRPPFPMPGLPPPFGFRPPTLPDSMPGMPFFLPPMPPIPPVPPINHLARGMIPGMPPNFPGMGDHSKVAPHLNPAFFQDMSQQGGHMAELFAQAAARFKSQAASLTGMGGKHHPSEEEASDANQRNRAISSSAITRAMSDANAGDYESAVDTLRMAITLIKQSVTAGTETSQILIQSLQDCLHGIEQQAANLKRARGREHRSHEDRERGRSSGHKTSKHHRDRSRERRR